MQHVLSQGAAQHCSVFAAFLFFLDFALLLSVAKAGNVKAPARANRNIFFIYFVFENKNVVSLLLNEKAVGWFPGLREKFIDKIYFIAGKVISKLNGV